MQSTLRSLAHDIGPLAVKDPRFCLTLGVWQDEVHVDACVVCMRHPTEVAESLRRRQRVPLALGYRFWDYHVSELLRSIPQNTLVVDHGILHGPSALDEVTVLAEFFNKTGAGTTPEDAWASVFSPRLRHVEPNEHPADLPPRTRALWERLEDLRHRPTKTEGVRDSAVPPAPGS
ncbi:MAG: hypothetical protein P8188_19470 [Gemmatimonadota bacterium]